MAGNVSVFLDTSRGDLNLNCRMAVRGFYSTLTGRSGYDSTEMSLLSFRTRLMAAACALVQLSLPGTLAVVDAPSVRDWRGVVAQIEETTGEQCQAEHRDECIVFLPRSDSAIGIVELAVLPQTAGIPLVTPASHESHSRAPPAALR
jgi:hypothetical protein